MPLTYLVFFLPIDFPKQQAHSNFKDFIYQVQNKHLNQNKYYSTNKTIFIMILQINLMRFINTTKRQSVSQPQ